ncbi:37S ribosomal protein S24, mitochondrial [Colletotrichum sojae]|uniref:37S ribosomal protein S24, mitochondrial n=1 Tax=Colletotrichum sojae TaxID=2175907 RepID=A0A8H6JUR8_9PEZI|nr:37S ribosomal protein S24, mitochondrial [Colletotrichum sojae]
MASAGQALRLCARSCRRIPHTTRLASRAAAQLPQQQRRSFAASPTSRDGEGSRGRASRWREPTSETVAKLKPAEVEALNGLRKLDPSAQDMSLEEFLEREMDRDEAAETEPLIDSKEWKDVSKPPRAVRTSFWYDEEDPKEGTEGVMDEFDEDDMTSMAHGKLDEIREHRHYHRIMAWEMPLLWNLWQPFEPPKKDEVLRFRYTTYMGEYHPAEKKVVVEFSPENMGLTPVQADKLRKLVGARYNPEKDIIKMSCEKYEHQAQNKRYLSDLVEKLVENAKDPKDTFEDIPLDTRHHTFKTKPRFPKEWYMTPERKAELKEFRTRELTKEAKTESRGQIVDGVAKIGKHLNAAAREAAAAAEQPEMVAVRGARGKQNLLRR